MSCARTVLAICINLQNHYDSPMRLVLLPVVILGTERFRNLPEVTHLGSRAFRKGLELGSACSHWCLHAPSPAHPPHPNQKAQNHR